MSASLRTAFVIVAVATLDTAVPLAAERSGDVTFDIDVAAPAQAHEVKLWFPYPISDAEQSIERLRFDGNYSSFTLAREPRRGTLSLYVQWTEPADRRHLTVAFHARAAERKVSPLVEGGGAFPPEVRPYLEPEFWMPVDDPRVKETAARIADGKRGILARARAVYDWVLENIRRDPKVVGCGLGNVEVALASRSGKCADISSVFVTLARAAGIPSREVYGLRLGRSEQEDITDDHHCWAEFYRPDTGWVPVDPAEALKQKIEKRLDAAGAGAIGEYYFGAVDEYRIILHRGGRGMSFPEQNAERVNYFMYPYCEVDGKPLDYCRPRSFAYTIRFQEG